MSAEPEQAEHSPETESRGFRHHAGPWLIAAAVGLTVVVGGTLTVNFQSQEIEARRTLDLLTVGSSLRARLNRDLNSVLYLTSGVSSYLTVRHNDLQRGEIEAILAKLYRDAKHVRNFSIAVGYRITYTHPIEGNEKVIGLDYQDLGAQWPAVKRVIDSGLPVLIGPLKLIQGGNGLIYRVPIYIDRTYWGLLSSVIDSDALLKDALAEVATDGIELAIRGKDALGMHGDVFWGDEALFRSPDAHFVDIEVPGGTWAMALRSTSLSPVQRAVWLLHGLVWVLAVTLGWSTLAVLMQRTQMARLALFDTLTALPNRRLLRDRIDHALSGLRRNPSKICLLLFIDLDGFKIINDKRGHKAGDVTLQRAARRIANCVRETDTVGRWGGDEFIVFMENIDPSKIDEIIEKIRQAVETPIAYEGHELKVGASVGRVCAPADGATLDELLRAADERMYADKSGRRKARRAR